jgi:hypothetical protein
MRGKFIGLDYWRNLMDDKEKSKKRPKPLEDALTSSVVIQLFLGIFTGMLLDGGLMFGFFKIICLAYWAFLPIIFFRRFRKLTKWDLLYIKWGIFANIPLMFIALILLSILEIH